MGVVHKKERMDIDILGIFLINCSHL
jgi:hypothetical protein